MDVSCFHGEKKFYGYDGGLMVCCKECVQPEMINLKHKKCENGRCNLRARFFMY